MEKITAEEYINRLLNNDYSFLRVLSLDKKIEFANIIKKRQDYKEICTRIINHCKDHYFIFSMIYDQPEYAKQTIELIETSGILINSNILTNLVSSSPIIRNYLIKNIYSIKGVTTNELIETLGTFLLFFNEDLTPLKKHPDLNVRYIFFSYIIKNHKNVLSVIDDIEECFFKDEYFYLEQIPIEKEIMKEEQLCNLLILALDNEDYNLFNLIKEFILEHYKENSIASKLINYPKNKKYKQAFIEDADRLFQTSKNFQDEIAKNYSEYISKDLIESFISEYKLFFQTDEIEYGLRAVFSEGLQKELLNLVKTYLSISKDKTCKKLTSGSSAEVYKIGDFVIKLIHHKYEKDPCPDLFLIIKNLEEIYIKSEGYIIAGIEVQKYLSKEVSPNEYGELEELFLAELEEQGYTYTDNLLTNKLNKEQNARYLESYKDANTSNPESLPKWFKERPIVLIDRDNVRRIF